jgi:hypothetical protein
MWRISWDAFAAAERKIGCRSGEPPPARRQKALGEFAAITNSPNSFALFYVLLPGG